MKRLVAGLVVLGTVGVFAFVGRASAWTYGLTGTGECQADGSFKITWAIDNTAENETLRIKKTSNETVVPKGTKVSAHLTGYFSQTVDGTSPTSTTLTLKGNFKSDTTRRERIATVTNDVACEQPKPPVIITPDVTPPNAQPVNEPVIIKQGEGK